MFPTRGGRACIAAVAVLASVGVSAGRAQADTFPSSIWSATQRPTGLTVQSNGSSVVTVTADGGATHTVTASKVLTDRMVQMQVDSMKYAQQGTVPSITPSIPEVSQPALQGVETATNDAAASVRNGIITQGERAGIRGLFSTLGSTTLLIGANVLVWKHDFGILKDHFNLDPSKGTANYNWSSQPNLVPHNKGDLLAQTGDLPDGKGPASIYAPANGYTISGGSGAWSQYSLFNILTNNSDGSVALPNPLPNPPVGEILRAPRGDTTWNYGSQTRTMAMIFVRANVSVQPGGVPSNATGVVQEPANSPSGRPATQADLTARVIANDANLPTREEQDAAGYLWNRAQTDANGSPSTSSPGDPISPAPTSYSVDPAQCSDFPNCKAALQAAGYKGSITNTVLDYSTASTTIPAKAPTRWTITTTPGGPAPSTITFPRTSPISVPADAPSIDITTNPPDQDMPVITPKFDDSDNAGDPPLDNDGEGDDDCSEFMAAVEEEQARVLADPLVKAGLDALGADPLTDPVFLAKLHEKFNLDEHFSDDPFFNGSRYRVAQALLEYCQSKQAPDHLINLSTLAKALAVAGLIGTLKFIEPGDLGKNGNPGTATKGYPPGTVIGVDPAPGTRRHTETPKEDPADPAPKHKWHTGRDAPTSSPAQSKVTVTVMDPAVQVKPDASGDAVGTGSGPCGAGATSCATATDPGPDSSAADDSAPTVPALDFHPLAVPGTCTTFPFGIPCWVKDTLGAWNTPGSPPVIKITFPFVSDADRPAIDFSVWEPYLSLLRGLILAAFTIGLGWKFMAVVFNGGGGGSAES